MTNKEIIEQFENCRDKIQDILSQMDRLSWKIIKSYGDVTDKRADIGWKMLEITDEITRINDTPID